MLSRTIQVSLEAREYLEESPPEEVVEGSRTQIEGYELKENEFLIDVTEVIIMGVSHQVGFS